MDYVARPLGVFLGFTYPAYASFKALDSKSPDTAAQWLTYWIVFSFFTLVEYLLVWLLRWIPLYYTLKLGFLLWLQLPQSKGALVVYTRCVQPLLKKHEQQIDIMFQQSRAKAMRFSDWPTTMVNRSNSAADKVLQELEDGNIGEKGE